MNRILGEINRSRPFPSFVVIAMCWLFVILFGVWALPHTVFIRHFCMLLGATLGSYVIFSLWRNNFLKMQVNAAPIFMIIVLFFWIVIHLLWIGKEPQLQLAEFQRTWKKIILCFPFALGLGLGIRYIMESKDEKQVNKLWRIFYAGLCAPYLIFFVKYGFTIFSYSVSLEINPYLILSTDLNHFSGIPKYFYVFFCLPAFAVSIGFISNSIYNKNFQISSNFAYLITIILVPVIFIMQSDRNGMLYSAIIIMVGILRIIFDRAYLRSRGGLINFFVLSIFLISLAIVFSESSQQWKYFLADAKIAVQVEKFDQWKYQGTEGRLYPLNDQGFEVSHSNYDRIAWIIIGIELLKENPWGYGLMTLSYDHLSKIKWPDSSLSMTHSGWIDFSLGYGILATILLISTLFFLWLKNSKLENKWGILGRGCILSIFLVMITTEISSEIFINAIFFLVIFIAGLTLRLNKEIYH